MQELRLRAARTACARSQVTWLRDRLLKLGVHVVRSVRRVVLHLPRSTPHLEAWRHIALALGARAGRSPPVAPRPPASWAAWAAPPAGLSLLNPRVRHAPPVGCSNPGSACRRRCPRPIPAPITPFGGRIWTFVNNAARCPPSLATCSSMSKAHAVRVTRVRFADFIARAAQVAVRLRRHARTPLDQRGVRVQNGRVRPVSHQYDASIRWSSRSIRWPNRASTRSIRDPSLSVHLHHHPPEPDEDRGGGQDGGDDLDGHHLGVDDTTGVGAPRS